MRVIEQSFLSPEENLAFDEALLNSVEEGAAPDTLRIWESPQPFVVLGVAQILAKEVDEGGCQQAGAPIYRRCSAGGCVVQGPGSLNFTLALTHARYPQIKTIQSAYRYILPALASALQAHGVPARHEGVSDLAADGLKFSGNAQKRRRRAILHHGTLLYDGFDIGLLSQCLREPEDRPGYRQDRTHERFVMRLPLEGAVLAAVIREAFGAAGVAPSPPLPEELEAMERLAREKYVSAAWIRRR